MLPPCGIILPDLVHFKQVSSVANAAEVLKLKTFIDPKFSQPIPNIIINYIVNFVSSPCSSTVTTLEEYKTSGKI